MSVFIDFGKIIDPSQIKHKITTEVLKVCKESTDFELIEYRQLDYSSRVKDIIVVDCINPHIPSRNKIGIKVRERLALCFSDDNVYPEVRALRNDFPYVLHCNAVHEGEPTSLCLYFEPWENVERTWTPQNFLKRIMWWLEKTASGTLHRADQPVEQFYLDNGMKLVLPLDFEEKIKDKSFILDLTGIEHIENDCKIIVSRFITYNPALPYSKFFCPLVITTAPIIQSNPISLPSTLGELSNQLLKRGIPFTELLGNAVKFVADKGLTDNNKGKCVIFLNIPIKRDETSGIEDYHRRAFIVLYSISELGKKLGLLYAPKLNDKLYPCVMLGSQNNINPETWQTLEIIPLSIRYAISQDLARKFSGIQEYKNFKGILAGVGALGGALADIWSKCGWGEWTLIDNDIVEPHNITRHISREKHIGHYKVNVVRSLMELNYQQGKYLVNAIPGVITDNKNDEINNAIKESNLLIDVTTTIEVPRELAILDTIERAASAFLTPSGKGSVIIFEDNERSNKLDSLESQYYRELINNDWGKDFIKGNNRNLWVGAGCRDISAIIPYEDVQFHAALLAKQIRFLSNMQEECIKVNIIGDLGDLTVHNVHIYQSYKTESGNWKIIFDEGICKKLFEIRLLHLPNETGGVIVGYVDQKLRTIYIVDVLCAPPDSKSTRSEFIRGTEGLTVKLNDILERTAHIVGYIGEWHSHPKDNSANPSNTDIELLHDLASVLLQDGQPALMIIVSDNDISFTIEN